MGRGRTFSSPGGQRNVSVIWLALSTGRRPSTLIGATLIGGILLVNRPRWPQTRQQDATLGRNPEKTASSSIGSRDAISWGSQGFRPIRPRPTLYLRH